MLSKHAKKAVPPKSEDKPVTEENKIKEKSSKTVQELDREKLDAKFSKKKVKLN